MYGKGERKLAEGEVLNNKQLAEIRQTYKHYERTNWESDSLYWMAMEVPNLLATIAKLKEATK